MIPRFHDRHERLKYLKALETARRIMIDPALIDTARVFVRRAMAPDSHQSQYAAMWERLLTRPAHEVAAALTEDSETGRLLRDTSPVFGKGFTSREVAVLLEQVDAAPP